MKLAYNPSDKPALTGVSSDNKDIIFDLSGIAIYARGVKFDGKTPTVFKKHTSANTGGYDGLVPAPSYAANATRFLREDGTWETPDKTASIHWDNIDGKPDVFNPSQHIHTTNDILSLTNYTKATGLEDLTTSDTLNVALGKLEYKSDLGVTAYDWYKSVTDEDTDEHINKWNEIVDFLNGITDTTLNGILTNFVNDLEVTGSGNAVTDVSKSNNKITVTKGNSFLPLSGGVLSGHLSLGTPTTTTLLLLSVERNSNKLSMLISGANEGWLLNKYSSDKSTALIQNETRGLIFKDTSDNYFDVWHSGNLKNLSDLNNDLYWANVPVSATSNSNTSPTFLTASAQYYNFKSSSGTDFGYIGRGGSADAITFGTYGNQFINIMTNSSTRMHISGSGNVGIGTTSPRYQLETSGDILVEGGTHITNSSIGFNRNTKVGGRFTTAYNGWQFHIEATNSSFNMHTEGANSGIKVTWLTNGNMGLGTTSPEQKLHVNGGLIRIDCNSRYVYLGAQNSSHAHYETNADISHWFNKRVEVNGHVNPYTNNSFSSGISDKRWSNVYSYLGNFAGTVSINCAWPNIVCNNNASGATESNIRFEVGGTNKGYVGYNTTLGTWVYNSISLKYLAISDSGTPHVSGHPLLYNYRMDVTSTFNANNMTTNAVLYTSTGDIGSNTSTWSNFPTGKPAGGFGLLNITEGGYRRQIFGTYNNPHLYTRYLYYSSGLVWSGWSTIALTSDIPTVTNYYWANLSVQSAASNTTVPSFGAIRMNGASSAGTNYITGTAGRIFFGGNFHIDAVGANHLYLNHYTSYNVYMCSGSSQGKVGIRTSSPSYPLHVAGDAYATGWSRAGSGFYIEGQGVHYMSNGSVGQIYLSSNNEFNWGASNANLYFNYRAASAGTTVTNYIWNAGSSSSYATHKLGSVHIYSNGSSYNESIRIHPSSAGWHAIVLCGSDNTGDSGVSANTWGIYGYSGDIYINKGTSSSGTNARAMGTSTGWTFGNTSRNSYALNAASFICDSWVRTCGATGWYNESYGGGWYMTDGTWIRNYNNKPVRISVSTYPSIECNADSGSEANLRFAMAGTVKGYVGFHNSYGTFLYNSAAAKYVYINNSGYFYTQSYINVGAGNEKNASNPPYVWGVNGSDNFMRTYATSSLRVAYATSAGSASSASSANGLASTGYGTGNLTYYQTDGSFFGNSGWSHYIIANHGNGSNYYNYTIALPFWDVPKYKRLEGGTADGWHTFITSENISSQSVNYASSAGNANTVDGYHIAVQSSAGTDASTIYFVI